MRVSFLASAALITRMRFEEPHTAGTVPFHARELVTFTPILEGLRYIGGDRRLLATVFVKGGIGVLGANNVLLPILGERVFPVKLAGLEHSAAGAARHEPADGRARRGVAARSAGGRVVGGRTRVAPAARDLRRLPGGGGGLHDRWASRPRW